jgi:hypothetical protein
MSSRTLIAFSVIVFGFAVSTQAHADGYGDTGVIGTDDWTGGEAVGDAEAMAEILAAAAELRKSIEQNQIDQE